LIPVITTRVSAIPELVQDGKTGRLVEVDDIDAFADAIAELSSNPDTAKQLSHNAAERVADLFNQDKNIDELLALFAAHSPVSLPNPSPVVESTISVDKAA